MQGTPSVPPPPSLSGETEEERAGRVEQEILEVQETLKALNERVDMIEAKVRELKQHHI